MWRVLAARFQQGHRTMKYPEAPPPPLPDRLRGLPVLDASKCPEGCRECVDACPTDAVAFDGKLKMDLGKCLFCSECSTACPTGAVGFTTDHRLAVRKREHLVTEGGAYKLAEALDEKSRRIFGRSLQLRQVSAGGCNGCEADVNVLATVVFDLARFGIKIVASPRHADGLLITGPVSKNMRESLKIAYDCTPSPKFVIAVGACAINGGPYIGHDQQSDGADKVVPIDMYIPGCPPHPMTILDGLLRLLGRIDDAKTARPAAPSAR